MNVFIQALTRWRCTASADVAHAPRRTAAVRGALADRV